jgi:FkbM family methyltransferase
MNIAKKALNLIGLDVRLMKNVRAYEKREYEKKWAESHQVLINGGIQTILDIGANTGQFAKMIVHACPQLKTLHSFEPLAACHVSLRQALAGDPRHFIHGFGMGEKTESVLFNHAEFTPCSSMLTPKSLLTQDHPGAGRIKQEIVEIRSLDSWAEEVTLDPGILVKIDVQGYEDRVIRGGIKTLKRSRYVLVEVPFHQLYEEQPLFHNIYMLMRDIGFVYRGNTGQNIRKSDGCILEADALFENISLGAIN